jgi:putative ABC transport system ATP-binding protein
MTRPEVPAQDRDPVIDISDLAFRWHAAGPIVLALEQLRIERGEHLFIAGPSGSGKSTLLSLLAGVATPGGGSVRVLGRNLAQLSAVRRDHFRADHIGYIFQMFNLIPYLSMVENVLLPCRFSSTRRTRALARTASLEGEALRLLGHLDIADRDLLDRPVTTLSVGQQQRVAAARALMGSPELLVADEPTSALDANRRESFVKLLFRESRAAGSTLVFVSHDASLQPLFDRAIDLAAINRAPRLGSAAG